jgi:predicted DNA-binding transcriptional regulator YafY
MSSLAKLRRLYLLLEKVENGYHPTKKEIRDHYYDHGFEVSERTLDRDIDSLRVEFGIELAYSQVRKGYYVDRERSINVNSFYKFLEYAQNADMLSQRIREDRENLGFIHFESQGSLTGLDLLKDLMFAIRNHRIIEFTHYNFLKETRKQYHVHPYGLKEYQNRWYVVGRVPRIDNPLKFGIDRIEELKVLEETFEPEPDFDIHDLFDDVVGLSHTESKKEEVVLRFTPLQGKYIKTLPIHESQEIVEEDEEQGMKVRIKVKPNFELIQKLMMQCEAVTVLQPQWLADEMQRIYRAALKNYGG